MHYFLKRKCWSKCHPNIYYRTDIFGVSAETIYHNLEEIARNNNVSRDSLLFQPKTIVKNVVPSDEVDLNELVANFSSLEQEFADVIGKIEQLTRE